MSINGIVAGCPAWRETGKAQKNSSGTDFASRMANVVGTNASENGRKTNAVSGRDNYVGGDTASIYDDRQESKTKTDIIVRPDGSRVLVMTMSVGGMETTMSLEVSKPTKTLNENSKPDADNNMPAAENDTVSDEMSDVSNDN